METSAVNTTVDAGIFLDYEYEFNVNRMKINYITIELRKILFISHTTSQRPSMTESYQLFWVCLEAFWACSLLAVSSIISTDTKNKVNTNL